MLRKGEEKCMYHSMSNVKIFELEQLQIYQLVNLQKKIYQILEIKIEMSGVKQ